MNARYGRRQRVEFPAENFGKLTAASANAPHSTVTAGQASGVTMGAAVTRKTAPTANAAPDAASRAFVSPNISAAVRRPAAASPATSERSFVIDPTKPIHTDIANAKMA